ncbi:DUF6118 family protein [Chelatococcus asaccharovorans]|uniref:Uncharacterized protein n=1 Tax=Chelatococcus asaccharovorans TaxID=28210 RepID=A0A2V3TT03_9HYPH|nr:DUF6118 family protein [Chelatococcus asaccharovorans]MBS7708145.1 hypothetical protein [Chelatococcus asaccharovorans]PXW50685.1 hypothetical protein C7450_1246 [Chelatococcus asaccharovorans]
MTDDDREGFEPEVSAEDTGDPAAAFEALRRTVEKQGGQLGAEMTIIRKGVELALEQSEKVLKQPDYGPDLGKIIQFLAVVDERLEAVEQSPILRNGPEHYARALERSGESLVKTAAQQLEGKGRDLEREALNLAAYTKSAYDRRSQDLRMWIAGGIGLLAGALLVLLLPRILPFAADTHVAAIVIGQNRWSAGVTMMQTADPGGWRGVVNASQLARDNAEAIGQCAEAARTAGADQRCTIIVSASAR